MIYNVIWTVPTSKKSERRQQTNYYWKGENLLFMIDSVEAIYNIFL